MLPLIGLLLTLGTPAAAPPACPAQPVAAEPVSAETERQFAEILELEDRRSAGGGALLSYLDQAQPLSVRIRAALAIGRIGSPVTTPFDLIAPLKDPEPTLRRMAVFALGEIDDPKAGPLLASSLADPDAQVRALAAEALGKLKDPASLNALSSLLSDSDPAVVGSSLLALWKIDSGAALADLAAKAAGIYLGSQGELRRRAAYFLMRGQMGRPEEPSIERPLLRVARDVDPLTRSYAARGLGADKSQAATESLIELARDPDWRVRVNAFNGLRTRPIPATIAGKPAWSAYQAGLDDSMTPVALAALAALETSESAEAGARLSAALKDERSRFREVALLAIAARDKAAALPALCQLAADRRWSVRARLAEAFGSMSGGPQESEISQDLEKLAADGDPRVRSVAVESLGKLAAPTAREATAAAAKDQDPFVRAAALDALASRGTANDALVALLADGYRLALTDTPNDARLAAISGLGKVQTDAARAELEKALEDPDFLVRRRAAEVLRERFNLERFAKVGEPRVTRSKADYLEAVRRARRKVTATIQTDSAEIVLELFPADAPLTVDNFIRLAKDGKLDRLEVHRVVPNFVIQDGDPRGDGNGGPPWQIRCEINLRRYGEGTVGMALSGKDTGGSQYFITHSPQPHLDGGYTVFGQVISGQETVNRILQGDTIKRVVIREADAAAPGRARAS